MTTPTNPRIDGSLSPPAEIPREGSKILGGVSRFISRILTMPATPSTAYSVLRANAHKNPILGLAHRVEEALRVSKIGFDREANGIGFNRYIGYTGTEAALKTFFGAVSLAVGALPGLLHKASLNLNASFRENIQASGSGIKGGAVVFLRGFVTLPSLITAAGEIIINAGLAFTNKTISLIIGGFVHLVALATLKILPKEGCTLTPDEVEEGLKLLEPKTQEELVAEAEKALAAVEGATKELESAIEILPELESLAEDLTKISLKELERAENLTKQGITDPLQIEPMLTAVENAVSAAKEANTSLAAARSNVKEKRRAIANAEDVYGRALNAIAAAQLKDHEALAKAYAEEEASEIAELAKLTKEAKRSKVFTKKDFTEISSLAPLHDIASIMARRERKSSDLFDAGPTETFDPTLLLEELDTDSVADDDAPVRWEIESEEELTETSNPTPRHDLTSLMGTRGWENEDPVDETLDIPLLLQELDALSVGSEPLDESSDLALLLRQLDARSGDGDTASVSSRIEPTADAIEKESAAIKQLLTAMETDHWTTGTGWTTGKGPTMVKLHSENFGELDY